ncbi:hypothetical protein PRK78_000042 [Emydomyces testavorans]|uniref:Uncharacterized protein n=1 Tax=Emydomyces testavorans TaxID=2070801 RepID=A0AAF0DBT9_9EURO|nr:hypothetical protein PRK78_000042 [Emydomyces testavorans]
MPSARRKEQSSGSQTTDTPGHLEAVSAREGKENKMQEERRRFLEYLPPDTHEYNYPGPQGTQAIIDQEFDNHSPFVIITNISPSEFEQLENHLPGRLDYSYALHTLLLKLSYAPQEEAADNFGGLVYSKARDMDVNRNMRFRGATDSATPDRKKQPDRSWGPRHLFQGRTANWPTVALEVAFSESREKVKRDMAWWLHQSKGAVLRAISIDIKRPSGNIYITSWERGTMPTRNHPYPDPRVVQEVKIFRPKQGQSPRVTGDALVIPFQHLTLRAPAEGEGDFIFTRDELLEIAEDVWITMDRMQERKK